MAKSDKKGKGKYKGRLRKRKILAKQLGGKGYYEVRSGKNRGKRYPKPLVILRGMIADKE